MNKRFFLGTFVGLLLFSGCKSDKSMEEYGFKEEPTAPRVSGSKVRLKTTYGDIVLELNEKKAPVTVNNFLQYVESKHYDGTVFHRIVSSETGGIGVVQGGGFVLEGGSLVQKKTKPPIQNEAMNGLRNERGTISMARTAAIDSATSQFFLNTVHNAGLDYPQNGGYAVFGKVVEGMDVLDKIQSVPLAGPRGDTPTQMVLIESATVEK